VCVCLNRNDSVQLPTNRIKRSQTDQSCCNVGLVGQLGLVRVRVRVRVTLVRPTRPLATQVVVAVD